MRVDIISIWHQTWDMTSDIGHAISYDIKFIHNLYIHSLRYLFHNLWGTELGRFTLIVFACCCESLYPIKLGPLLNVSQQPLKIFWYLLIFVGPLPWSAGWPVISDAGKRCARSAQLHGSQHDNQTCQRFRSRGSSWRHYRQICAIIKNCQINTRKITIYRSQLFQWKLIYCGNHQSRLVDVKLYGRFYGKKIYTSDP